MPQSSSTDRIESTTFTHAEVLRVMYGLMLCILLAALDQTAVIPAVPAIAHDLHAYTQLSWIIAAYLIASTISTSIFAKLSDQYGRKTLLFVAIGWFIVASVLCGAAPSLGALIWFRALQGLGGGGVMALTQSTIADVVSPRERGRYQGYISGVWALSSIAGPIVGGLVAEYISWRWIFWINLPVGLAAIAVCRGGLRRLKPPVQATTPKLDLPGMALLSGALLALLLALAWGGHEFAWSSTEIVGLIVLGAGLLIALRWQEQRAHDPLLPPRVFKSMSYLANVSISMLTAVLLFMFLFSIPIYFQFARGASTSASGFYVAPFMFASAIGSVVGSKWGRHFGAFRAGQRAAAVLCLSGSLLLALMPANSAEWVVIVGIFVTGLGVGGSMVASLTSAQNALGGRDIGAGTGALLVMRAVGGASGSTLAGALLASSMITVQDNPTVAASGLIGHSFALVFAITAVIATFTCLVTLRMPDVRLRDTLQVPVPVAE
jgi:EmrB/QacA subfamily drug resistance transporter